jgi:hypothetical protein
VQSSVDDFARQVNFARFDRQPGGHYESFFIRANHPSRPLAFWIRYTVFSPKERPAEAIGELWAMVFDGQRRHVCVKEEHPIGTCRFARDAFDVSVGRASLRPGRAQGHASGQGHDIAWELNFSGSQPPLLLLRPEFYERRFPAAKSVVSLPMARFNGSLAVDGGAIDVEGWVGSQNHNWGFKHTDLYAWGQVAGFDSHADGFLEVATARLRIGPFWTPPITPLVLRLGGREWSCTGLWQAIRASGRFDYFRWQFATRTDDARIEGEIEAPREAFVALGYRNPPGGTKVCLNTKIARCSVKLTDRKTGRTEHLQTENRGAFEILTDDRSGHGLVPAT